MQDSKNTSNTTAPIVLYTTDDGKTQLEVKLDNDTVWLSQSQMAELFGRDRTVISRHIRNIFSEGELEESLVCAKFAHTKKYGRKEGFTQVTETTLYNLDVIISVGYRVKSLNGTKFRIWANSILKQYIIKGYAIDQRRLDHYDDLKDIVRLMSRAITLQSEVTSGEYSGLFNVITDYVYALYTLDRYDYQSLDIDRTTNEESFHATYDMSCGSLCILPNTLSNNTFLKTIKSKRYKFRTRGK